MFSKHKQLEIHDFYPGWGWCSELHIEFTIEPISQKFPINGALMLGKKKNFILYLVADEIHWFNMNKVCWT